MERKRAPPVSWTTRLRPSVWPGCPVRPRSQPHIAQYRLLRRASRYLIRHRVLRQNAEQSPDSKWLVLEGVIEIVAWNLESSACAFDQQIEFVVRADDLRAHF